MYRDINNKILENNQYDTQSIYDIKYYIGWLLKFYKTQIFNYGK